MFEEGGALDDYEFSSDNVNIGEATDLGKTTPGTGQAGLYIEEKDEQLLVDGNATEGGPIDDNYNIDNDDELESKIDNEMNRQPSANTLLKLKKMDHKLLIAQEIEFRKQQVRAMDRGDGPHPLETVVKKEQTLRRPMTVNEEIFLGLGIGENEKDPLKKLAETRKSQNAYLNGLNKDMAIKEELDKLKKDDDFFEYRNRKPVERKIYDGMDIDPNSKAMAYGANEAEEAAKRRAEANKWMVNATSKFDEIKAKKRADRLKELEPPSNGEFNIGKFNDGDITIRREAANAYAQALDADIASIKKDPSSKGLDISFTFGGKSRDDRPTTTDIRDKREKQRQYRELLDVQMTERSSLKAYERALDNAVPQALPPYAEAIGKRK